MTFVGEYRRSVPLTDFDGMRAYSDRTLEGATKHSVAAATTQFQLTSASSGKPKLIPTTDPCCKEYVEAPGMSVMAFMNADKTHPDIVNDKQIA
jgi:hypothetical protein